MNIIVWRTSFDPMQKGLKQFQKIIDEYRKQGIEVKKQVHQLSTFRVKVYFYNDDTLELVPALESDIRGRRYDIGYISKDIDDETIKRILISNNYMFHNHDKNIRYY